MFDLGNAQKTFIAKTPRVVRQRNKPEQRKVGLAITTIKTAIAGKAGNGRKRIGRCMVVTKAVIDKLVYQEMCIMGLEARIEQDGHLIAALQTLEAQLQHEIDDLDSENIQLLKKLQDVETVLNQQTRDINCLFSLLEQKPSAQVPPDADKTKKPCNNVCNVSAAFTTI
jgi:hypothetical protein